MSAILGKLLIWTGDHVACVRIVGRANFLLSVDFRKLLRHLRAAGHARILLDLSECQVMDSTFLGVLAFEANDMASKSGGTAGICIELLNARPAVREIIEELGIARLFHFVERDLTAEQFRAAPSAGPASVEECARTSLEVHELLMALHPANVAKFKEVARFLATELKQSGTPGCGPGS